MTLAFIYWNIDPEITNILGFSLRYYGSLFALGIMLSTIMLKRIYQREGIALHKLDTLTLYGVLGIILGARLGHCLFYEPTYYLSNPLAIMLPVKFLPDGGIEFIGYQGLASHGGALGLLIALFFYSRKTGHGMLDAIDLMALVAPLGAAFIRLGNLMNSEIIGRPADIPWAFVFARVDNVPRHPAQLYEAISYLLILAVMFWLYNTRRPKLRNGFFAGLVLVLIFVSRFIIEFFKENQVGFEDSMTFNMGQLLSLPYILFGVALMLYGLRKTKRDTQKEELVEGVE